MTPARRPEGRFYIAMAIVSLLIALAGFGPAAVDSASRTAPLTLAVAAHGAVFTAWLVLFLTQALMVARGDLARHRRLGYVAVALAIMMVVSGYTTAITMARRGHDLSGDLIQSGDDPLVLLVFQLGDLLSFAVLVGAAVWYRRRPDVHKRLMLLATVGALLPAALAHIVGHWSFLRSLSVPIIVVPLVALLSAGAVHDRLCGRRIHPVSLWVALALFVWANVRAVVIGPSAAWHEVAGWLTR
jgi:hypothetical protein